MIAVISGTNRADSNSKRIAKHYLQIIEDKGLDCELIDLAELPRDVAFSELYGARTADFQSAFADKVEKAEKLIFIIPEYNGGFPGILKLFVDALPPAIFHHKKAGLVGLSSGAAGALRPMDQFSNVLNYLKVDVIAQKPKLSGVESLLNGEGQLVNERAVKLIEEHATRMIAL